MDPVTFARRVLRAINDDIAASTQRLVDGTYRTIETYREEVGHRRGLQNARDAVTKALGEDERLELASI